MAAPTIGTITTFAGDGSTALTTKTISYTVSAGNNLKLIVGIINVCTTNITGVTFNGVAMTGLTKYRQTPNGPNNYTDGQWFYLDNPDVGTHNVVATFGSCASIDIGIFELTNAAQGAPHLDSQATETTDNALTHYYTTTIDNVLVFNMGQGSGANTPTSWASPQTQAWKLAPRSGCSYKEQTTAGTNSMVTYLDGNNIWDDMIIAVGYVSPTTTNYKDLQSKGAIKITNTKDLQSKAGIKTTNYRDFESKASIHATAYADLRTKTNIVAHLYLNLQTKADLKITHSNDLQTKARIHATAYDDLQSKANLKTTNYKDLQTKARIHATAYTNLQTKADLKITHSNDLQTKGKIKNTIYNGLRTKADIRATNYNSLLILAYIELEQENILWTKADIKVINYRDLESKANLFLREEQDLQTKGTIKIIDYNELESVGNIIGTSYKNLLTKADIVGNRYKSLLTKAWLENSSYKELLTKGRIKVRISQDLQTKARIHATAYTNLQTKADLKITHSNDLQTKANIIMMQGFIPGVMYALFSHICTVRRRTSTPLMDILNTPSYGVPNTWNPIYINLPCRLEVYTDSKIQFKQTGEKVQPTNILYVDASTPLQVEDRVYIDGITSGLQYTQEFIVQGAVVALDSIGRASHHLEYHLIIP